MKQGPNWDEYFVQSAGRDTRVWTLGSSCMLIRACFKAEDLLYWTRGYPPVHPGEYPGPEKLQDKTVARQ